MAREFRPVLNPVLSLKRDARRASVTGINVDETHIKAGRLPRQRELLASQLLGIRNARPATHANRLLVAVRMFDDSLAPTHEPKELFRESLGGQLVAPLKNGYVAQIHVNALETIANVISSSTRVPVRVEVSRIESIESLSGTDVLAGRQSESIWSSAIEGDGGRLFTAWLAPFMESEARESVVRSLLEFQAAGLITGLSNLISISREAGSDADQLQVQSAPAANSIARAAREYRQTPYTRLSVLVRDVGAIDSLIASGGVFRLEPLRPLISSEIPSAPDPERPVPNEQWQPIVGVIDGGLFARSYEPMVAWRAPSLVSDVVANRSHGNRVVSLAVHGAAWNTHLDIPDLTCRVGIAQAIAKEGQGTASRPDFVSYLRSVIGRHSGDTKVWNMSFNEPMDKDDPLEMSELGHVIHKVAREFDVLPIVSVGNVDSANDVRLCPPADCEAAISVGGRAADGSAASDACVVCLPGPGPEGLKKPELSWFSTLRGLGGAADTGSSYAAAITSAVAAHTFHNLKNPSPDMVRALLINRADRELFDSRLGWGSPCRDKAVPWECPDGSVTLVWTSELRAGLWHYWEDIPIPPELITDGKIKGRVALTAVLRPMVSELGSANYFSTRLQVALQYTTPSNKMGNLAGSMKEDIEPEKQARAEHAKWNPIRHHVSDIPKGRLFKGNTLRVCARIFGRDLYQFGIRSNAEIEPSRVAFALTLSAPSTNKGRVGIYNSVATRLGTYVESAVNDIEVHVEQ